MTTAPETTSFVTHLESALDDTRYEAGTLQTTHEGRPLWVRYDLDRIARSVSRDDLAGRPRTMWRYRELLPVERESDIISLGETMTPVLHCPRLGERLGLRNLFIKDESRLPTGSFKSRGMAMAVTMAKALGGSPALRAVKRPGPILAVPTAGNAGGALAAYAARAGLPCFIFMPRDTPMVNKYEAALHGGRVFLVDGLITDCGRIVGEGREVMGWFDMSTLKEPYRLEGKKTMGLELAEQFDWSLPEVVLYPTGGGTGLIGMWKAFNELSAIGWLDSAGGEPKLPRLFACQSSGCAPIVDAFDRGERFASPPENPHTVASGLRVPKAVGDFMILDAVRQSGGAAMATEEPQLLDWMRLACETEGVALCPEAAACVGVAEQAVREGRIDPDDRVVIFNTGAAQKYLEAIETDLPVLDITKPIDWDVVAQL